MARTRVPVRGSIGKAIRTGQTSTTVNNTTVVNQTARSNTGGGGTVSSTIWPLIQGIPEPILDIAGLSTSQVGLLAFNGTDVLNRSIAVDAKLTITNPAGVAGNPTIGFADEAANTALMGPASGSAAGPTFRALTTSDIPALSIEDLSDVTISSVSSGQVLEWNGTAWVNASGGGSLSLEDLSDVVITLPMIGDSITWNGTDWVNTPSIGGGTVTSVALADLSTTQLYAISGSPITTAGTLDLTLKPQNANTALMGPTSGSAAAPTMRALTTSDIPALSIEDLSDVTISSVSSGQVLEWSGTAWVNAAGGGGSGAVTLIQKTTISGTSTASVTAAIPSGYTSLRVEIFGGSVDTASNVGNLGVQFNGDTNGAHYPQTQYWIQNVGVGNTGGSGTPPASVFDNGFATSQGGNKVYSRATLLLDGISQTAANIIVNGTYYGLTTTRFGVDMTYWNPSTLADVTSITILPYDGSYTNVAFAPGSTICVYGIS